MTDNLFDSFIKDKLYHHSSPVPKGLWEKIISEETKRPKAFWWGNNATMLILAGAILLGAGSYYSYSIKAQKTIVQNTETAKPVTANTNSNTDQQNTIQENTDSKNNFTTPNANSVTTVNANIQSSNSNAKINGNISSLNIQPGTVKATSKAGTTKFTISNGNIASLDDINRFNKSNGVISKGNNSSSKLNDNSAKKMAFNKTNGVTNNNDITGSNDDNDNTNAYNNFKSNFYKYSLENLQTLSNKNLYSLNNLSAPPVINLRMLLGLNSDCPSAKGNTRHDTYIEVYSSADVSTKTVKNISSTQAYLSKKDSAEKMQTGFTAGIRISRSITDNLLLKAGVQYAQVNEQFSNRTENERKQTTVITTRTIIRPGIGDTTISDTSILVQIGYRTQTSINKYKSIEIPVLLMYETGKADSKWKFGLTGGVIINASSWYSGNTYDENYNVVSIKPTDGNSGFYQHQLGFSIYGSASVIRNISPTIDVFAEPYFRYGLNKANISRGFTQQFNTAGINFGARIKINNSKH